MKGKIQTHVVKCVTEDEMQNKLNSFLNDLYEDELIDMKLTATSTTENAYFMAVIIYKKAD